MQLNVLHNLPWSPQRIMVGGLYFGPPSWRPKEVCGGELGGTVPPVPPPGLSLRQMVESAACATAAGLSEGCPDFPAQLAQSQGRVARALVVNCLPDMPESALPAAMLQLAMPRVVAGLALLKKIIPHRSVLLVLDRHDHKLRGAAKALRRDHPLRIVPLVNRYPENHPTVLLRRLFGFRLPVGAVPTELGVFVVDPVTLWALARFVAAGLQVAERPTEIFQLHKPPVLGMARIGETVEAFLARCGIAAAGRQCICNGMLYGREIEPSRAVIHPATRSVGLRPVPQQEYVYPCIRCGWCVDLCPTGLNPAVLHTLAAEAPGAEASAHCVGCGLCSYVCPVRLPLREEILRLRGTFASAAGEMGATPVGAAHA